MKFGKLFSTIWSDSDFIDLTERAQKLFMLLVSHSSRNFAGVLPLTLKRWANCSRDSTVDSVREALLELAGHNFIVVDWGTEEVLVRTLIRHDGVHQQPNLLKAALRCAQETMSPALRWALFDELSSLEMRTTADMTAEWVAAQVNSLVKGLERTPPEGIGEGFHEGIGEGIPEGPVVVGYVSQVCIPTPTPTPTPTAAPALSNPSRGSRLPEDWQPKPETIAAMRAQCPAVDLRYEHDKFTNYWRGVPGAKGRKCDWDATWRNWICRANEQLPTRNRGRPAVPAVDRKIAAAALIYEQAANPEGIA